MNNNFLNKHFSEREKELIKECHKIKETLFIELQREATGIEIANELGIKESEVYEFLAFSVVEEEKDEDFKLRVRVVIKNHELEKLRLSKGLKQSEVGKILGFSGHTYSQIEGCKSYPSEERQIAIANILGGDIKKLFPSWLKMFSQKWKYAEKSKVVPIKQLNLENPEVMMLPSGDYEEMLSNTESNLFRKKIDKILLDCLNPREKRIIEMRNGLVDNIPRTLEEIGKDFGVTRDRIGQIEAKALEKLAQHKDIIKLKK